MKMEITDSRTIYDIQHDFSGLYPFLKLEFYKDREKRSLAKRKERLPHSTILKSVGLKMNGYININNEMTVGELENILFEFFGLTAQVSRNSAGVWLETTMTDMWSLGKQNEYGREIIQQRFNNYDRNDKAGMD